VIDSLLIQKFPAFLSFSIPLLENDSSEIVGHLRQNESLSEQRKHMPRLAAINPQAGARNRFWQGCGFNTISGYSEDGRCATVSLITKRGRELYQSLESEQTLLGALPNRTKGVLLGVKYA
jgi:hypothetical protein